jgi:hypothetical protein
VADRKISDLTALTTPATGDLLPIVDISEAAAADKNKSITVGELLRGAPDGTAAAPGIAFESDPNSGIYSPGADQVAISTNGSARLYIDASGRVGFGVTSFSAYARADNLVIDGTGHRGITIGSGTSSQSFIAFAPNGATGADTYKGYINYDNSTEALNFGTASSESARIDSSGRLLVNTSSALSADTNAFIHAAGPTSGNIILANSQTGAISAGGSVGAVRFFSQSGGAYEEHGRIQCLADNTTGSGDKPGRLVFSTTADGASSPTEAMRINRDRDVFINRTDYIIFSTNTTDGIVLNKNRLDISAASVARITQTRNATGTFDRFYSGTSIVGDITTNGSTTSYNTSSDYRLKENVTPVTDSITRLQQLKPSRFNFIADPTKTVDGFLAHEVQTVVPEAISGEKDAVDDEGNPQYQGIDQSKLVPLLTAALQEAITKIETLEAKVAALEAN